jgi:hypothetical protein
MDEATHAERLAMPLIEPRGRRSPLRSMLSCEREGAGCVMFGLEVG